MRISYKEKITASGMHYYKIRSCNSSGCSCLSSRASLTVPMGAIWQQATANAVFPYFGDIGVVIFKDKIYAVIAPYLNIGVWSSSDGKIWTQEKRDIGIALRYGFEVVTLKDKMYLIGASDKNDVWYSN